MNQAEETTTENVGLDSLDILVPKPAGWKVRLAIGASISLVALCLGLGFGQGYLYPNPLRADFEVASAVVVPAEFGDGNQVYVQFMLTNTSWRDVRLTSLRVDDPDWERIGSYGEPIDLRLFAPGEDTTWIGPTAYLSEKYWGEEGSTPGEAGSRYELATSGLENLPLEISAGESALVTFVTQAKDCDRDRGSWEEIIEADFEFARGSTRLPLTRTERFTFSPQPPIEVVTPNSDEEVSPNRVAQELTDALCEAVT